MQKSYLYQNGHKMIGPYSAEQIKSLVLNNTIKEDTVIEYVPNKQRRLAGQISGLRNYFIEIKRRSEKESSERLEFIEPPNTKANQKEVKQPDILPVYGENDEYYRRVICPCCGTDLTYRGLKRGEAENLLESVVAQYKSDRGSKWFGAAIATIFFPPVGALYTMGLGLSGVIGGKPKIDNLTLNLSCENCGKRFPVQAYFSPEQR